MVQTAKKKDKGKETHRDPSAEEMGGAQTLSGALTHCKTTIITTVSDGSVNK